MSRGGNLAVRLGLAPVHLVAMGVVVAFGLALLATRFVGLPIWFLIVPVVGAGYVLIVIQRPMVGLLLVICIFFIPVRIGNVTLLQSVGVATACVMMIWFLIQRRKILLGNFILPLSLIGLLILVSLFFTRDVELTAVLLRLWMFNMCFVLLLINLVTRFDQLKQTVWAILLMAVVNSVTGVAQYVSTSEAHFRSVGLLQNANKLGNLAVLAFPLALYQFLYRRGPIRWLALVVSGICVGGVVASVSRGALISLIVVFCVILVTERRRILALSLIVLLAAAVVPFLPRYFFQRVENLTSAAVGSVYLTNPETLTSRGHLNKGGLRIWMSHPVFGVGVGNFGKYFVEREFNPGMKTSSRVPTHNIYLQALVEMGAVGFLVLIWLILITLRNVMQARRLNRGNLDRWIYLGGIEMMALSVLISSFSSGTILAESFWLVVSLPGVASRLVAIDPVESTSPRHLPGTEPT